MRTSKAIKRTVLFLSALDYKSRSIQVIRKTPEAYAERGWKVVIVVARDTSVTGTYFYEPIRNPKGCEVRRFRWPLTALYDKVTPRAFRLMLLKARHLAVILALVLRGVVAVVTERPAVLYGYEYHGVLAMAIVAPIARLFGVRTASVARFQGTFFHRYFRNRDWQRILFELDHLLSFLVPFDVCIMTNDGTNGDKLMSLLRPHAAHKILFLPNGVDRSAPAAPPRGNVGTSEPNVWRFLTVSRLVNWKRVDRVLLVCSALVRRYGIHNFHLDIVGEGDERQRLTDLVRELGLDWHTTFHGPVDHSEVSRFYRSTDLFFSMYEHSNVGNPLLESIDAGVPVVTLDNGETAQWITNGQNGLLFREVPFDAVSIASSIRELMNDPDRYLCLRSAAAAAAGRLLWTWQSRFDAEETAVRAVAERCASRSEPSKE